MTQPTAEPTPTPVRASRRGPRILIASGAVVLVLALVAALGAGLKLVDLLPFDVLAADGEAGASVAGVVEAPGSAQMVLEPGRYAVWLVRSSGAPDTGLVGDLVVLAPDGTPVDVRSAPSVSGSIGRGGRDAHTVAGFTVTGHGTYTVEVPEQGGDRRSSVLVTTDTGFGSFMTGIVGTIGLGSLAAGLGVVGVGLVVGGAIAGWTRSARATPAAQRSADPRPRP